MIRLKNLFKYAWAVVLMVLTGSCGLSTSSDDSAYRHLFVEEEAYLLVGDESSPYCDFSIDFTYLNDTDSIAALINEVVQGEFLGGDYANLTPEAAVDSFKNTYLREYRKEVGELYRKERTEAATDEEIPAWFGQTYSLVTFVEEGRGGVINASANYFIDMGGAHPHQWSRWLNFDFVTGKVLVKEDVFHEGTQKDIEILLLQKLVAIQAELNPDTEVKTLDDLQELGFLQMTDMYIPDNFLLGKNALMFLFNRYDIAPYSAGEIVIEVPYGEIGHYLKR